MPLRESRLAEQQLPHRLGVCGIDRFEDQPEDCSRRGTHQDAETKAWFVAIPGPSWAGMKFNARATW
jgi:hypothetical protein